MHAMVLCFVCACVRFVPKSREDSGAVANLPNQVDEMITQLATVAASSAMHRRLARAPLQGERTMTFIV